MAGGGALGPPTTRIEYTAIRTGDNYVHAMPPGERQPGRVRFSTIELILTLVADPLGARSGWDKPIHGDRLSDSSANPLRILRDDKL